MKPPETYGPDEEGLALLTRDLRAERPEPDPEFAAELDRWAAAGFPRAERPGGDGRPGPLERLRAKLAAIQPGRMLAPVGAAATLIVVVGIAISSGALESGDGGDAGSTGGAPPAERQLEKDGAGTGAPDAAVQQEALAEDSGRTSDFADPADPDRRKVASTADLVLASEPEEVREVSDGVNEVVNRYRGIVVSSSVQSGEDSGLGSSFQLRLPASNLQAALADLSELAHVQSRTESTEDITGRFISAQERIEELNANRDSILNQLEQADTEEEADALRRQLAIVNDQLSAARAELDNARQRVQLVPVTVSIVAAEGAGDDGDWGVSEAFEDAGDVLSTAAGILVVAGAILLPLALVALLFALALRARNGRARERALDE
jgi:Domain of unknown function (DUF4349)